MAELRRGLGALVVVVGLVATPACAKSTHRVAMPRRSASPVAVLRTYLEALDAHDFVTARALLDPHWRSLLGTRWDEMAANVRHIGNVRLQLAVPEDTALDPRTETGYVDRYDLQVNFDLQVYNPNAIDRRPHAYGYTLIRVSPAAPWRLVGEGMIPA